MSLRTRSAALLALLRPPSPLASAQPPPRLAKDDVLLRRLVVVDDGDVGAQAQRVGRLRGLGHLHALDEVEPLWT